MDPLATRRALQVVTGTLVGLAVVAVLMLGLPGLPTTGPRAPLPFEGPHELTGGLRGDVQPTPPFALRSIQGDTVTHETLHDQVSVFFFGFTHCPDVCPITLANLTRAFQLLDPESHDLRGYFVSVDPRRDTHRVLERYMDPFHPDIRALTGGEDELLRMAEAWGVHVAYVPVRDDDADDAAADHQHHHDPDAPAPWEDAGSRQGRPSPPETGPYTVDHTARSIVVDRDGRMIHTLAPYLTAEEMAQALRPLLAP